LDYGRAKGIFARIGRWIPTRLTRPGKHPRNSRFTVLSRNDAGFALILSETARKIDPFARSVPSGSLNALNVLKNLTPAARHRRFHPESRPLRFQTGTFVIPGAKRSHSKQAINLKGNSLSSRACAFLGQDGNVAKLG
jgi:hypothetical protein